jgi:hypothetical protein
VADGEQIRDVGGLVDGLVDEVDGPALFVELCVTEK